MNTPAPVPQSNFVTVLAWVMIAFGIFGVLMGLLQNVFMNLLLPAVEASLQQGSPADGLPFALFRVMMLLGLAFSVFVTYGAFALLKRRNWARILYVVLFIFSALMHLVIAVALGFVFFLPGELTAGSDLVPSELRSVFGIMAITFALVMLAMGAGYVWLVRRLLSPAIAAEFGVPARPAL